MLATQVADVPRVLLHLVLACEQAAVTHRHIQRKCCSEHHESDLGSSPWQENSKMGRSNAMKASRCRTNRNKDKTAITSIAVLSLFRFVCLPSQRHPSLCYILQLDT
jgi:hypothetical protein